MLHIIWLVHKIIMCDALKLKGWFIQQFLPGCSEGQREKKGRECRLSTSTTEGRPRSTSRGEGPGILLTVGPCSAHRLASAAGYQEWHLSPLDSVRSCSLRENVTEGLLCRSQSPGLERPGSYCRAPSPSQAQSESPGAEPTH